LPDGDFRQFFTKPLSGFYQNFMPVFVIIW